MSTARPELAKNTLAILCILGLIGLSLWVLTPFLGATVWAVTIVVATWPLLRKIETYCGGRRTPAVAVMSLGLLFLLIIPLWMAVDTIYGHFDQLTSAGKSLASQGLPMPPDWVAHLPLVGEKLAAAWQQLAEGGGANLIQKVTPYAAGSGKWLLSHIGGVGGMLIQFFVVVLISAILYSQGEAAALMVRRFGRRLAGQHGEGSVILAGQAIRGVALGVGVTAIVQTVLGGIGLALVGVPYAGFLTALMLMFCIAQVGPMLVLLPAVGWMYWQGDTGWATFLLVWSLIVGTLDNFIRPVLIKRGADLPLLLIFTGVLGGMLSFGLIGIFLGPVALAVTYTLLQAWVDEGLGEEIGEMAAMEVVPEKQASTDEAAVSSQNSSELT